MGALYFLTFGPFAPPFPFPFPLPFEDDEPELPAELLPFPCEPENPWELLLESLEWPLPCPFALDPPCPWDPEWLGPREPE